MEAPLGQRKALQDVQHLQGGDALRVGRNLADRPAAVVGLDRLHPLGLEIGKVVERHRAALLVDDVDDGLRGGTLVVAVAPLFRDAPQGAREVGIAEDLARAGRAAVDQERRARVGVLAEQLLGPRPQAGGDLHQGEAVLGVEDRRRERHREGQRAEALAQGIPSGHHAGHRDREGASLGHLVRSALAPHEVGRHRLRGPAAGVQAVELVFLRHVHQREQVSADSAPGRLHHSGGRVGGDGRIDGIAAALEDLHSRGRGERLAGGDDAVARGDD